MHNNASNTQCIFLKLLNIKIFLNKECRIQLYIHFTKWRNIMQSYQNTLFTTCRSYFSVFPTCTYVPNHLNNYIDTRYTRSVNASCSTI